MFTVEAALRVFVDRISIPARSDGAHRGKRAGAYDWRFACFALFWGAALTLGGAGADYPLIGMMIQVGSVLILTMAFLGFSKPQGLAFVGPFPTILAAGIVALPLLQLLPLPPALWQALPGRERAVEIYGLLGWKDAWLPLSLDPEATKAAALSLLPGLGTFFLVRTLTSEQRLKVATIMVGAALIGALLGALQITTGGAFTPFDSVHRGHALGFFTNRNHQALFLLIAMPFACAIFPAGHRQRKGKSNGAWAAAGVILILAAAVLATKSRSGAAFLLIILPFCAVQLGLLKFRARTAAIAALIAGLLIAAVMGSSAVQDLLARFGNAHDDRVTFWTNTLLALKQSGGIGTGFGTFQIMYRAVEPLADLKASYVNHAHSDYLEVLLEGGLPALVLLLAVLGWIGARGVTLMRSKERSLDHRLAIAALAGMVLVILHSVVDYPLRMLAIEAAFGFLCALLIPAPPVAQIAKRRGAIGWLAVVPVLGCLYAVVVAGLAGHALTTDSVPLAEALSNRSSAAASYAARSALDHNPSKAMALAETALRRSPLDAAALSTLALAQEKHGDDKGATALMNVAASAGWWDDATQIWMFDRARDAGRYDTAMERADALLRREVLQDELYPMLLQMANTPEAATALLLRLEERPDWRGDFLQWADNHDTADRDALDRLWAMLARSDAPPSAREAAVHIAGLIRNHRYAQARRIWAWAIRGKAGNTLFDGDFTAAAGPLQEGYVTPFQWTFSDESAAINSIDQPPSPFSGVALNVTVDPGFSGTIARQMIVLPPGSYRLGYAMLPIDNSDREAAAWSVRCVNSNHTLAEAGDPEIKSPKGWQRMAFRFDVPADCAAQWIELRGTGSALSSSELWYDRIAIARF